MKTSRLAALAVVALLTAACSANSTADVAGKYNPLINKIEKLTGQVADAVPALELAGALTPEQGDKILAVVDKVQAKIPEVRSYLAAYVSISDSIASHNFLAAFAELQRLFLDLTNSTLVEPVVASTGDLDTAVSRAIGVLERRVALPQPTR